jgi:uncharacterized protein with von Willebrand factor type A (vWA) domain
MPSQLGPEEHDLIETVVGFARTLRVAGVPASADRVQAMLVALRQLNVLEGRDVYWAGRLTLCASPDDVARYDIAFVAYFRNERLQFAAGPPTTQLRLIGVQTAADQTLHDGEDLERNPMASRASDTELLRQKDFATLTADERDEIRRMIARLDPNGATRRSLRLTPASRGALDPRRTVRAMLRHGGETDELLMRRHTRRPRRVVLLIDVSGSMEPYADAHLRFAHVVTRRRPAVEVFTIGTRLTRVTRQMQARDPDVALREVADAVPDWSGGTRLGELLKAFLDRWGQRGTARGAVVVIASDGWERGDATLLGEQTKRLRRLAHSVIWVSPHAGRAGFAPITAGLVAALPNVDALVAGHTVEAFAELASRLSERGDRNRVREVSISA